MESFKLKNDQYRRKRGGQATFLDICCSNCGSLLLVYQKDGTGGLHRCYLNRIFYPPTLERLQHDKKILTPNSFKPLWCEKCKRLIASPMLHHEGRLAFRLIPGTYTKRKHVET